MLLLNFALLIWEVIAFNYGKPNMFLFFFLEVLINLSVAFEILMRAVVQQKLYFTHCENIFDVFVLLGSLVFMVLFILFSSDVYYEEVAEGIDIVLLAIRYLMSFLRSIIIIKNQNKGIRAVRDKIDLRDVSDDEKRENNTFSHEIDINLSDVDEKSF